MAGLTNKQGTDGVLLTGRARVIDHVMKSSVADLESINNYHRES